MLRTSAPRTREDVEAQLRKLMSDGFDVQPEDLSGAALISHLGRDSIGALELTMAVEDEFDLEIPEAAQDDLQTFDDVAGYLTHRLGLG